MINGLIGKKISQTQAFLEDGTRVPVSRVMVPSNRVMQLKTKDKEGYNSIQLGIDNRKNANKALTGHTKKAGILNVPRFLKEIRVDELPSFKIGDLIEAADVLKAGDVIDVMGVSKGKGYAGVVKRHHFKGGPRTHGQSDRERAPGSIGQTTTPGRVYKGKRMAGRMGTENVTVKNLLVLNVEGKNVYIKGLIPGNAQAPIVIKKVGEKKKFVSLFKKQKVGAESASADTKVVDKTENKKEEKQNEK